MCNPQIVQYTDCARICDCGLFAIAMAIALCHGISPGNTMWYQCRMREHLVQSFENGKMLPFLGRNIAKPYIYIKYLKQCVCKIYRLCIYTEYFA